MNEEYSEYLALFLMPDKGQTDLDELEEPFPILTFTVSVALLILVLQWQ